MRNFYALIALLFCFQLSQAQFFKGEPKVEEFEGFFDFYYHAGEGKIYLKIEELDKEFLYANALAQGIGSNDIGMDRGQMGGEKLVKFIRSGNKVLLIQPNQRYRAETDDAYERNSVSEAFAKSVLYGFDIVEENGGSLLIDLTGFIIRDEHGVVDRLKSMDQGSYQLDKSSSAIYMDRTKAFPKNVEFEAMMTFRGKAKGQEIRSVVPSPDAVTTHQHHSFVELPPEGYNTRVFDPRSGSYPLMYMDYASPVNESIYKKLIYRHRLEKKDPTAEKSEAVDPIVYYLDPGTPEPIRSALLEGASWWNQAFEAAGYVNAFQVKILPADADPLDLRYNVIQWVHRSTRGWSYGNSIADPRTGEIIKGHVSLGSLRIRQDFMIAQALKAIYAGETAEDGPAMEMALARIRQLSAHEVGHTLGFAHNFAASTIGRTSVMDYPHPWIKEKNGKLDFSEAYAVGIGSWDKVTVRYAYGHFDGNESEALGNLLNKAFEEGHRYVTDQDARPAGGSNVFGHLWDNGSDLVEELDNVMAVRKVAIEKFGLDNIPKGNTMTTLEDVFVPLYFYHRYQTEAVVKLVAGTDFSYSVKGGFLSTNEVLDAKAQKRALEGLMRTLDAEEIAVPKAKLELFPARAFGQPRTRESFGSQMGTAFDPFGAAATAADFTFSFLLHPERAARLIAQSGMDKDQLSLHAVLDRCDQATLDAKHKDAYLQQVQWSINAQYFENLYSLASDQRSTPMVKAVVMRHLEKLAQKLAQGEGGNLEADLKAYWSKDIKNFLKNPTAPSKGTAPKIPDGSPIGSGQP